MKKNNNKKNNMKENKNMKKIFVYRERVNNKMELGSKGFT